MKKLKMIPAALAMCAAMLLSVSAQAQTAVFVAAGSSAMFNDLAYTATVLNSQGYVLCGPNVWTVKSNAAIAAIQDNRAGTGVIANEPGNLWVTWNGSANGTGATKVCAYIAVDSSVGVRAAMAQPAATLFLASSAVGTAGAGAVPNLPNADSSLPANVQAALNGQTIGIAVTDVRPEDAKFATIRALSPQGGGLVDPNPNYNNVMGSILLQAKGLGYAKGTGTSASANIGNAITSVAGTVANPVNFALFGADPFTNQTIGSWQTFQIGAAPVVFFVNTTATGTGHLGDGNCTNTTTPSVCGLLDGTMQRNTDLCEPATTPAADVFGVGVWVREPISGTYNTTEYATTGSFQCFSSQEKDPASLGVVNPASNNPLNISGLTFNGQTAYRKRAITTGEMVKQVANTTNPDSFGYAFWGYGNFSSSNNNAPTQTHYLTLDGIDPLYSNGTYNATTNPNGNPNGQGVFPVKTGGVYPVLPFTNLLNGSYRVWTTYRFLVANITSPSGQNASDWAQLFNQIANSDAATIYSDFVPFANMTYLHDHYYQSWTGGYNDCSNSNEAGGDMGGLVFTCAQVLGYPAVNGNVTQLPTLTQKHM
jgi:hypothetical protein